MKRTQYICSLVLLAVTGCSTHYAPQPGPRISTTVRSGGIVYVRNGESFPHGFAGEGLVDAVASDADAKAAAETYHRRNVGGFVATAVGAACLTGGVILLASEVARDDGNSNGTTGSDAVMAGAMLCAVGGLIAGPLVMASGQTYQFDAVNIYNDHVDRRTQPAWPGPGAWPWGYPTTPLPGIAPDVPRGGALPSAPASPASASGSLSPPAPAPPGP